MKSGRTVFAQLLDFVPMHEFNKSVARYDGNKRVKSFSCYDQFIAMAFAQITQCDSLRAIEACFRAAQKRLYHCGFRGRIDEEHARRREQQTGLANLFRVCVRADRGGAATE